MKKIISESTDCMPTLASTVRHQVISFSMGFRWLAWWTVLVFAHLPAIAFAQSSCSSIQVKIPNIKSSAGIVACAIFESSTGFPTEFLNSASNIVMLKIRDTQARCNFLDIPPGTYSLVVIHDKNKDGKLGTNFLGVPTEDFGFSADAKALVSAPTFEATSFSYDGKNLDLTIRLTY
ncbi:MAG: hypothetical protein ACI8VC_001862 [Candidatus Endobugula sp.]|jgi:uncharacterized protein (DUF2141 family)